MSRRSGTIGRVFADRIWQVYDSDMADHRAVILNGGTSESASQADSVCETTAGLLERLGWGSSIFRMRDLDIAPCKGCFHCWIRTPGECIVDDPAREIAREFIRSDLAVFITPIVFGGYSHELKKGIDRLIPVLLPYFTFVGNEVHHVRRYRGYPNLLGIGILPARDPEEEAIFSQLLLRNSINMYALGVEACIIYAGEGEISAKIEGKLAEVIGG
ncbi:flavodoxin family protein [Candidatus Acetothermia bacterium]|nr:MAG: flavodoxin family protein [Candidatus Acetothermia bacterium]